MWPHNEPLFPRWLQGPADDPWPHGPALAPEAVDFSSLVWAGRECWALTETGGGQEDGELRDPGDPFWG